MISSMKILELMKQMENSHSQPQWVSGSETVFEALWNLVSENGGDALLKQEFPQYHND